MSKITVSQFQIGLANYIENEIVPNIPATTVYPFGRGFPIEINQSLIQFVGGIGIVYGSAKIEAFLPTLKTMGLIDNEDMIDIDQMTEVFKNQMKKVGGKLKVSSISFNETDIDTLASYLTQKAISV